jgi:hypothetical protein
MNTLLHELKGVKSTVNEIAPVTGTQANVAVFLHEADTRIAKLEALLTTQRDLANLNTKVYIYIYIFSYTTHCTTSSNYGKCTCFTHNAGHCER